MANRLANQTSPYLLQHKNNPVDWYPWGEEALNKAKAENKPVLLSIGYSSCHWCHVMAHESFENPDIANTMNRHFVNIKVDREERPDLDSIYMDAVQAMTGQGGWPMTVFITPDGKPFYGGTYFPPEDRMGMPSFPKVLTAISDAYQHRRQEIEQGASDLERQLSQLASAQLPRGALSEATFETATSQLAAGFDEEYGGFGQAPKFPQPMILEFLLRHHHRTGDARSLEMATRTLDAMVSGGMYDQLGGGFSRYSVDRMWLIPHFEKMLYDNAQLAGVYLNSWLATGNPEHRRIAEETLDYLLRDMASTEGGFYSAEDADSEGHEGKFYVWYPEEVRQVLGDADAEIFNHYYNITDHGNFEGKNVLSRTVSAEETANRFDISQEELATIINNSRERMLKARNERVRPGKDDKILTGWNGLALRTFAEAASALERDEYLRAAIRNAEFVTSRMANDGQLLRTYREGQAAIPGFLEDYAAYGNGLVSLYEATFDARWLLEARRLADTLLSEFWDESVSGFFDTGKGSGALFTRPRNLYDNAVPSGTSLACTLLLRLSAFFVNLRYEDIATATLEGLATPMSEHPNAFGQMLCAAHFHIATPLEIVFAGPRSIDTTHQMLRTVRSVYLPNKVVAHSESDKLSVSAKIPLLESRTMVDDKPAAYVCHNHVCERPVTTVEELRAQLGIRNAEG